MSIDELNSAWAAIDVPAEAGALAGRPAPTPWSELDVTIAVDHAGLRHLLIAASPDVSTPESTGSRGLEVTLDELRVGDQAARSYLDLACSEAAMHPNFSVVVEELLAALAADPTNPAAALRQVVGRWKWFWSASPAGMTEEQQIGLFAELWFIEYWLGGVSHEALTAWRGPYGDRHDFVWPAASVEVKGTRVRTDGAAKHRISTLDQLDAPESGLLHLFSVRVRPDTVAANSLVASIDRLRGSLKAAPDLLLAFDELLGRAGYSPAHRDKYGATLRVAAEELYVVGDGFPRLVATTFTGGVPAGIGDISYSIDLAACQPWLVARNAAEGSVAALRAGLLG